MKISFKPVIDNSEQLNLRISPTLKQRIENLRTHTKKLGLDYNATLLAHIEDHVTESEKQLVICYQSASKMLENSPSSADTSGLISSPTTARSNGPDPERA